MAENFGIFAGLGSDYTLVRQPHGIAFLGSIPLSRMDELQAIGEALGLDQVDFRLPGMLSRRWDTKVAMVLVSQTSGDAWVAELEASNPATNPLDRFIAGPHCGISAQTIIWVLAGRPGSYVRDDQSARPPYDSADFARCLHLLKAMPAWRDRLGEVADRFEAWRPLVQHWDELEQLIGEEVPDLLDGGGGPAPLTWARMRELLFRKASSHTALSEVSDG